MSRLVYDPEVTMLLQSNLIEGEDNLLALSDAMRAWDFLSNQRRITHSVLKTLHRTLMDSQGLHHPLDPNDIGIYRNRPVYISGRAGVNPSLIRPMLESLFMKLNERRNLPVSDEARAGYAKIIHVQYEQIHPFMDGNGRTGRMLYNWHRLALQLPIEVIGSDLESRKNYYNWFKES